MHDANIASSIRQGDKAQPRRAQRLDQAEDIRRRDQGRRQIWLCRSLRRPHHRGSRRRAGHVLQSLREPPGTARSVAAEDRHRHGATSSANAPVPRMRRGRRSNASAPSSISSARCRSSCASSTRPNSSRRSATRNISTIFRPPMSASSAARVLAGAIDDFSDEEFEAIVHMLHGRARLSQPPLFLCRRHGHRRARTRHLRLSEADDARAVQRAG